MNKIFERIKDTIRYNLGIIPEKEFYVYDHVERGNIYVLRKLIDANPDLISWRDMWDESLLHIAVQANRSEVVQWLIDAGCDVNARDVNGESPLHVAASLPSRKISEILLKAGADPHAVDNEGNIALS